MEMSEDMNLVTFTVPSYTNFGRATNLEANKIVEFRGDKPNFLEEFEEKLKEQRLYNSKTVSLIF